MIAAQAASTTTLQFILFTTGHPHNQILELPTLTALILFIINRRLFKRLINKEQKETVNPGNVQEYDYNNWQIKIITRNITKKD